MKQRIGSDLGAAIKKSCCRAVVDRCFYNDQTGCIDGCADIADFRVLRIYTTTPAQPIIAGVKWNGFDNFTGNSLSHLITPTIIIVAKSRGQIKGNLAGQSGGWISILLGVIIFAMERFYGTKGEFVMDNYRIYRIECFA